MNKTLGRTLTAIMGCILIGLVIYITRNAWWLFGLFFVYALMEEIN